MTTESIKHAQCVFRATQSRLGKQVYKEQLFHKCRTEGPTACRVVEIPNMDPPHYVCTTSQKVHVCGYKCEEYTFNGEEYICKLTGIVLPFKKEERVVRPSKDNPKKLTDNNYIMMGHKKGRKRKARKTDSKQNHTNMILEWLIYYLCGPERMKLYKSQKTRFKQEVRKHCDPNSV